MPIFSDRSKELLAQCHPILQDLMNTVIQHKDIKIVCGARTIDQQRILVERGASKTMNSRHIPRAGESFSRAVDIQPFPYPKKNQDIREELTLTAGIVYGLAIARGIPISRDGLRWGGDWNCNEIVSDNGFDDLFHFEYNL